MADEFSDSEGVADSSVDAVSGGVKIALERSIPAEMPDAPNRFAPVRSAPLRMAPLRVASLRSAPYRFAEVRSAPSKFTSLRVA